MMSILDLNDDCLSFIFDYFSIYELMKLEKVCSVFKSTCINAYTTRRFHRMRIELRNLKPEYFSGIFKRVGGTLRNFQFSGGFIMDESVKRTMIDGVTKFCPKLQCLTINYTQFSTTNFIQLQKSFENLTCLNLSNCDINEDSLGMTLDGERFQKIKTLKLAGNSCMNGSFFKNMIHAEVLDVSYCYELQFEEFFVFLKNCIKLLQLNVSASCRLVHGVENFLIVVNEYQPLIETLQMEKTGVFIDEEVLSKFVELKVCSYEGRRFGT